MEHKYSTYALMAIIASIVIIGCLAALDSSDIDDVCNLDGKVLYRDNGTWICKDQTGWIEYIDDTYNTSNRLTIGTTLMNYTMDSMSVRIQEAPSDITWDEWFNKTHFLTDKTGNAYLYRIRYNAEPQGANVYCEIFMDIGEPVGQLPIRMLTFPKGIGIEQIGTFTNVEYTLGTWFQNGAVLQIQCSDDVEFWNIEITIERQHIGRGTY